MKDSINMLFRDRFQGHELPVDPGVWQGITQQMAPAVAPGDDALSKLFKDRFQGHETPVDPAVWQTVAEHLGHGTTVVSTAGTGFMAWAAAGIAAVALGTAVYFIQDGPAKLPQEQIVEAIVTPSDPPQGVAPTHQGIHVAEAVAVHPVANEITRTVPNHSPAPRRISSPALTTMRSVAPASTVVPVPAPFVAIDEPGHALVEQIITEITEQAKQAAEEEVRQSADPNTKESTDVVPEPVPEIAPLVEHAALPHLFMPNTFTPNGDGVNDDYEIGTDGFERLLFRVYSMKTNQLVFSTNTGEKWTGSQCEDGYYLVAVEAVTTDGRLVTEGKVVWLNRTRLN